MKAGIHPEYVEAKVTCSCGNTFTTRSTMAELHVELCNECHPFYTGKQKLVDSGGRVERFQRRYGRKSFTADADTAAAKADKPAPKAEAAKADKPAPKAEAAKPAAKADKPAPKADPDQPVPKAEAAEPAAPKADAAPAAAEPQQPEPAEAGSAPEPVEA